MKKLAFFTVFIVLFTNNFLFSLEATKTEDAGQNNTELQSAAVQEPGIKNNQDKIESQSAAAENPGENKSQKIDMSLVITKINFSGLKKTRESFIQSKVKKFIGRTTDRGTLHELETQLQSQGIFEKIELSPTAISEEEAEIQVTVKEKITFIPLPFAMVSGSNIMAGLVIMDTNAFGIKDNFVIGGFISNTSKTAMAIYSKAPKDNWIPGFSTNFSIGNNTNRLESLENEEVLKYESFSIKAGLSITEKFKENYSLSLNMNYNKYSITDDDDYPNAVESGNAGMGGFTLRYSRSDWNGYFMSTTAISASAQAGMTDASYESDHKYPKRLTFSISDQHQILSPRLRFYLASSGSCGWNLPVPLLTGRSAASVTILPANFQTSKIVGGNTGLEFALVKGKYGLFSIYADYQFAYAKDTDNEYEFSHGPNGGLRVYLSKIAFPALAVGFSYNVQKNYPSFAASMGVSF